MGDRSSSQDMVEAEAPFCRQSKIGHQLLLFLLPTYRWGKRLFTISDLAATSFFQDWMARKTGSILDKEHVNYFFFFLLSLFPFQTVTGLAPSFFFPPSLFLRLSRVELIDEAKDNSKRMFPPPTSTTITVQLGRWRKEPSCWWINRSRGARQRDPFTNSNKLTKEAGNPLWNPLFSIDTDRNISIQVSLFRDSRWVAKKKREKTMGGTCGNCLLQDEKWVHFLPFCTLSLFPERNRKLAKRSLLPRGEAILQPVFDGSSTMRSAGQSVRWRHDDHDDRTKRSDRKRAVETAKRDRPKSPLQWGSLDTSAGASKHIK